MNISKNINIGITKTLYVFIGAILANLIFAFILLPWATEKDINGLTGSKFDKFITLFYFGVTIFTTTGFGDVYPKSNKLKIFITLYMLLIISFLIHLYI